VRARTVRILRWQVGGTRCAAVAQAGTCMALWAAADGAARAGTPRGAFCLSFTARAGSQLVALLPAVLLGAGCTFSLTRTRRRAPPTWRRI